MCVAYVTSEKQSIFGSSLTSERHQKCANEFLYRIKSNVPKDIQNLWSTNTQVHKAEEKTDKKRRRVCYICEWNGPINDLLRL